MAMAIVVTVLVVVIPATAATVPPSVIKFVTVWRSLITALFIVGVIACTASAANLGAMSIASSMAGIVM
jgi:hypothetical protein